MLTKEEKRRLDILRLVLEFIIVTLGTISTLVLMYILNILVN